MGMAGPLAIVTPAEFRKRTALTFSSRSGSTLALDKAYDSYHATRSEAAATELYARLTEYRAAHGNSWDTCERNKVSGGLLEYLHNAVRPGALSPTAALAMDRRAAARIRDIEIPHARFGVLYLLAGVKLHVDAVSTILDGLGAIGGTVGIGLTTNFHDLGSATNAVRAVQTVHGMKINASQVAQAGTLGLKATAKAVDKLLASSTAGPATGSAFSRYLPTTAAALDRASTGLSELWDRNKYLGGLAYTGAAIGAVPVAAITLVADAGRQLWEKLKAAFKALGDVLMRAWSSRYDLATASKLSVALKKCTVIAIDHIMKNAVPFLGGAVDIGTGLARTIGEACTRIASWADRRHIRIRSGHPREIANAIEHQMTLGLCGGLIDILKGAAKVAVGVFLPGLGSLVSVAMSVIEWLIKFISRLGEQFAIEAFLLQARNHYDTEKRRSRAEPAKRKEGKTQLVYEPNTTPGSIITDTERFTSFFRQGCQASPLIPMLVLNSGLGGSLMTLVDLFDPDGSQSTTMHSGRKEFNIADTYFRRLKVYSAEYMRKSGFHFLSAQRPGEDVMTGYLEHATGTGKDRQSHVEAGTSGERLVAAARA
jgi:hypothetical protein